KGEPDPGDLLETTVQWTCFKSTNRILLRDNSVTVLGHSSGCNVAINHARRVSSPKLPGSLPRTLRALILLAASLGGFDPVTPHEMSDLGNLCHAFLGINVSTDTDGDAWGEKQPGQP